MIHKLHPYIELIFQFHVIYFEYPRSKMHSTTLSGSWKQVANAIHANGNFSWEINVN